MLFSIIVPMYNVEKYADKCIRSIITQSFFDFELILVDDGSTDNTSAIIDMYAKEDSRIVSIHKENGGLVSARKAGARIAKGDYIVVVDGDDWVDSTYLEYSLDILQRYNPDIICFNYFESINSKDIVVEGNYGSLINGFNGFKHVRETVDEYLINLSASLWSKIFKRELYIEQQLKVSDIITMGEDGMVTFPIYSKCNSIFVSRKCFYHYRQNPCSMTKNRKKIYSGKSALYRIALLDREIRLCKSKKLQIATYCAHSVINVSLAYFRNLNYFVARKVVKKLFENKLVIKYLSITPEKLSIKEKMAFYIIKFRWYPLIKILSLI